MRHLKAIVRVPATTANLGPGFDCLGVALSLSNRITISREPLRDALPQDDPMLLETGDAFFSLVRRRFDFWVSVQGDVPRSRGLGSSVTVRGGIIAGLNQLASEPFTMAECLNIVCALEGHPDNAAPAFLGGFTVCTDHTVLRVPVKPRLLFIAAIPELEIQTHAAREVLPESLSFADAVQNVRHSSLVAAAFASQKYELLESAFRDRLHQPARKRLLPVLDDVIDAGVKAGALGGFLSGSGSTVMCVALKGSSNPERIAKAMLKPFAALGIPATGLCLTAHNKGLSVKTAD